MREMLEPLFGELGALIAQFVTTVVVVLALIAVVYWLVRRSSGLRLGGIGRGRVPRLAIVDAMAIDSRRRLVLVRRDNVEHLIMIGGPSDLVVEPSIVRLRQRGAPQPARTQRQQPAAVAPPPAPTPNDPETPTANAPIPFPPPRVFDKGPAVTAAEPPFHQSSPAAELASPPDSAAEEARHTALAAGVPPLANTAPTPPAIGGDDQPAGDGDAFQPFLPEMARLETDLAEVPVPRNQEPIAAGDEPDDPDQQALDLGGAAAPGAATDASAESPTRAEAAAAKVSDLEEEMARLLGEISAKRLSS